jgi:uncharacterized membrane protein
VSPGLFGKYAAAYAAIVVTMAALDYLWLGVVAKPLYQQGIGHLMASRPNVAAMVIFYALFPLGLIYFAVMPHATGSHWSALLCSAALFGLFTYATYGLTNLATLRDWPAQLLPLDIAWGILLSTLAAAAGKFAFDRL